MVAFPFLYRDDSVLGALMRVCRALDECWYVPEVPTPCGRTGPILKHVLGVHTLTVEEKP